MSQRPQRSAETWLVTLLLRLYPRRFRQRFGDELLALHLRRLEAATQPPRSALRRGLDLLTTAKDLLFNAPLVWRDEWQWPRPLHPRGESSMRNLVYEALQSARVLSTRQRAFTALCVLTLALGLGATTAIFTVVHGVLLAPLPYGDPDRIVRLYQTPADKGWGFFTGPNFNTLRERAQSFEAMAGFYDYRPEGADLTSGDRVERLDILRVSSGYFEALGVDPVFGRTFEAHEEIPPGMEDGAERPSEMLTGPSRPVVLLSHGFWQRRYNGDPGVVGTSLELDRQPLEIVGILPANLGGHVGGSPDVWLPLDLAPGGRNTHGNQFLSVVARLAPGVTLAEARAELARETEWLKSLQPHYNQDVDLGATPLEEEVVGPSRSMLALLLAAVGAMLAIACINVANLFLARGVGRRRELGLRLALGAGGKRLFTAAFVESLWVGVAGGVLGLGVAWIAVRWLHALRPAALPRYDALELHWPVFGFCALAVLLTVLLFGLGPSLAAARSDVRLAFGARGGVSSGGRRDRRIRDFGVSLQVALSLVLLAAGGLTARSFLTLHTIDLGFDTEDSLTFQLRLPDYAYEEPETRVRFYDELFSRLDTLPDLVASGATSKLPGSGHRNHWGFRIEGREIVEGEPFSGAEIRCVTDGVLEALEIPLLAGRALGPEDRPNTKKVVLVNQALVDKYFDDDPVLGIRLGFGSGDPRTIVGVITDTRHDPREKAVPKIYVPQSQFADDRNWDLSFVAARAPQSMASWAALRAQVEAEVAAIDPRLVVFDARPMAEVVAEPIARQRFSAQLTLLFATISLLLAAIGLFGALAYSLSQRRAEIGIRMALGADQQDVLGSVLGHGLRVFSAGAAVGLFTIFLLGRWLESILYQVEPTDPTALAFAVGTLFLVATLAALKPAVEASRLDPAKILRES